jgi:YVTN family beta-propeller protein
MGQLTVHSHRRGSPRVQLIGAATVAVALIALAACSPYSKSQGAATTPASTTTKANGSGGTNSNGSTSTTTPKHSTTTAVTTTTAPARPADQRTLTRVLRITGDISPKSVDASGRGLVTAQNMMYRHTITVYGADGVFKKTIPDTVTLSDYGFAGKTGPYKGAPVEAAYSPDGKYEYVSNYSMYGPGYGPEGSDTCGAGNSVSPSTVYRIDLQTLTIDDVTPVAAVPKYLAVSPNGKWLVVSNWCGYSVSIIDTATFKEVDRIPVGAYPRGIAIDANSHIAYVAQMGGRNIAKIDLQNNFALGWIYNVGAAPRHLVIDPAGRYLYATLNGEGKVAKIDLLSGAVVAKVSSGKAPRSMAISPDGLALYVVNYESSDMTKFRTSDMALLQTVPTDYHPIGITYEPTKNRIWVACYGGSILVFSDT